MALKKCKDCGKEISSSVNKCPSCGKDQRNFFAKHKIITAILVLFVLGVIGSLSKGGSDIATTSTKPSTPTATSTAPATTTPAPAPAPKAPPMVVTADKLMEDLKSNALNASNTYKRKYVEVTGKLSNIDSGGKYFDIAPDTDFAIIGVQCYITQEQKATVAKFTKDQKVTVIGTITDVGEIMGYSLKVESIK